MTHITMLTLGYYIT